MLVAKPAPVGALVVDSYPYSIGGKPEQVQALRELGVRCLVGYLGSMNVKRLDAVFDAGLAFMPVTKAGEYLDGAADEIAQLKALGIPAGASVWLDLEGRRASLVDIKNPYEKEKAAKAEAELINKWADDIRKAGYLPCLYVGVPQPFTSAELYSLRVYRYWHGQGSVRDRFGALAEPFRNYGACRGWNMVQAAPSVTWGGVLVDANLVLGDYKGETPVWVVREEEQAPAAD